MPESNDTDLRKLLSLLTEFHVESYEPQSGRITFFASSAAVIELSAEDRKKADLNRERADEKRADRTSMGAAGGIRPRG